MRRPQKLGAAMAGALKGLNLDARMREGKAMALWPAVVGDVTAAKTRPLYVNRGTMVVLVASAAWANQLNLLKPKILAAFAERCGPGVIRDIRWKASENEQPTALPLQGTGLKRRAPGARDEAPLPEAERQAIEAMLRTISDPAIAATVERTLTAQARRRQRLKAVGWVTCKRCGVLHDQADRPFLRMPRVAGDEEAPRQAVDPLEGSRLCPVCRMELNAILD